MTDVLQIRRKEGRRLKQSIGRKGDDIWAWMQIGDSKRRRAQWQKSKKVSENNNQPDDQHGGEMGLRGASARERHSGGRQPTLHCASVAISGHVVHVARHDRTADRTTCRQASGAKCTIDTRRDDADDADVPISAAVEAGRAEVFLGDPGRASDVSEGTGVSC